MPAQSRAQRRLFAAAEHGADFPMARKLRASMSMQQMHDFAATSEKGLPPHVASAPHPHRNLKQFLHPKKARLADRLTALRTSGAFRRRAARGSA